MFESAISGLLSTFEPFHFAMLMLGMGLGLVIGLIPGMGGTVGLAVTIPFIIRVEPSAGIILLIGVVAVTVTSGAITSIMLGIPGTVGSVATIVDGYPMARKGEAARAISASLLSSAAGGLFGALILALSIPIARPLVMQFGSPEFFMLTVLGISAVGVLAGRNPTKGLLAAGIGLMMAAIGGAPLSPYFRYSLDIPYLYDGIPLVLVALGIFGVAEIVDLMVGGLPIAGIHQLGKGTLQGFKDVFANKWMVLRCSAIGTYIGFVPGLGPSVANWLGYGHAVQSARGGGDFGQGDVRGVMGPESANNAAQGGSLIPTLMFGVPGSGGMALMLVALIMFGVYPGPDMVTKNLPLVFSIVFSLVIANVVGALICVLLARQLARISLVPIHILAPFVIVIIILAALQATNHWGDLILLLLIGILGWTMKQTGFARPPLLVGFVLGILGERYLGLSVQRYGMAWLLRPWTIGIGIVTIATLLMGFRWQSKKGSARLA